MLVKFIDICAIPNSSIYQPIAFTCFNEPGMLSGFPSLSYTISPITGCPSLFIRPFSLTSKAIALASLVDLVFRLILYAIKKSLTPMAVAPDFLLNSFPKSGFQSLPLIFFLRPSYSPDLTFAKFLLLSSLAAFSYKYIGIFNSSETFSANFSAYGTSSSIVILETGIKGQTSVAPNLGCSPLCLDISIFSLAVFIALNAAATTESGSPTNVITVLFVACPGSTFSRCTPLVLEMASDI